MYGGGVSVYTGGYASLTSNSGPAIAATGETLVRNVKLVMSASVFTSCFASVTSNSSGGSSGTNAYGGSFSFYIGSYSYGAGAFSNSFSGGTSVIGVAVSITNVTASNCFSSTSSVGGALGSNAYGGSMSVLYIGAYTWSLGLGGNTCNSSTGPTAASDLSVSLINTVSSNCSAVSSSVQEGRGMNSYGGSMVIVYVGAYAFSFCVVGDSICSAGPTTASEITVSISNVSSSNCSAATSSIDSRGTNAFGGAMVVVYIGSYAYSYNFAAPGGSSSTTGVTNASGLTISINNSNSHNCRAAVMNNGFFSGGANAYGGAMLLLYVGAFAWSLVNGALTDSATSVCVNTSVNMLELSFNNSTFIDSSALSSRTFCTPVSSLFVSSHIHFDLQRRMGLHRMGLHKALMSVTMLCSFVHI